MYVGNVKAPLCSLIRICCCFLLPAYRMHALLQNSVPPARTITCSDFYLDQVVLPDSTVHMLAGNLSYWVVIAIFHIIEYLVDPLLSRLPLYELLKLGVLLWISLGNGSSYLYKLITRSKASFQLPTFETMATLIRAKAKNLWAAAKRPPSSFKSTASGPN